MGSIEENEARWAELDRIDAELCSLAAHVAAGMCRFLLVLAEFEAKGGLDYWGCHSVAQWLNMRLGVSLVTGREQARVARALGELPAITAAFAAGELSYSKVRALTRFARPETDGALAEMARFATASHLDRLAREMRGVRRQEEADQAVARHRGRFVHTYYDDDGCLVIHARLAPEDGAVVAALDKAGHELARDASAEACDDRDDKRAGEPDGEQTKRSEDASAEAPASVDVDGDDAEDRRGAGRADALVAMVMVDGRPLCVADQTQTPPRRIRRALRARDGGCRWPGCEQRRWVDAHHIVHWADGGPTCLDNLVLLCRRHPWSKRNDLGCSQLAATRCARSGGIQRTPPSRNPECKNEHSRSFRKGPRRRIHENGFTIDVVGAGRFEFHSPDGRLLAPAVVVSASAEALAAAHQQLDIGPSTAVCQWGGERMDYGCAIDGILSLEAQHRRLHQRTPTAA